MRKNCWRRWTAFLLAVCMSISLVLGTAQGIGAAAESSQSQEQLFNGIYYQTDDAGNAVITGMEGNFSVLDIPSSIDGYPVTAISESAFHRPEKRDYTGQRDHHRQQCISWLHGFENDKGRQRDHQCRLLYPGGDRVAARPDR